MGNPLVIPTVSRGREAPVELHETGSGVVVWPRQSFASATNMSVFDGRAQLTLAVTVALNGFDEPRGRGRLTFAHRLNGEALTLVCGLTLVVDGRFVLLTRRRVRDLQTTEEMA